jgi:hypothetical protein
MEVGVQRFSIQSTVQGDLWKIIMKEQYLKGREDFSDVTLSYFSLTIQCHFNSPVEKKEYKKTII